MSFSASPRKTPTSSLCSSAPSAVRRRRLPASAARPPGAASRTCSPSGSSRRSCATFSKTKNNVTGRSERPWVVLKFGGTSVSSAANWQNIAAVIRARLAANLRPVIVHSALSGITDRLESLIGGALEGRHAAVIEAIEAAHRKLSASLEVVPGAEFDSLLQELRRIADSIAETREPSDRLRARVMAMGELLATTLGAAYLNAQGIATTWIDARRVLRAEAREGANARAAYLSATCDYAPDPGLQAEWAAGGRVVITQGFIAANEAGETVLLGRGGSDTSGAYFAAKLAAARLEIWTDVPGMFSANPRDVPNARLLRALHYDEAQEIASNGAKVLHPRCVMPVRQYGIPLHVYATQAPQLPGTIVSADVIDSAARVKAIAIKKGITLVSMDSPGMWHQVGFLADAFQVFKQQGLSVDLVSTSETNVTVSLDPAANTLDAAAIERLTAALGALCRVKVLGPCASLSLLGQNIRGILHELGAAFELFQDQKIYLVTQAANDLNFTFVIDESQGDRLVQQLHERLIQRIGSDEVLGPTWQELFAPTRVPEAHAREWWQDSKKRAQLIEIAKKEHAAYVYDPATIDAAVASLGKVRSIDRWAYAMKANWHAGILRRLHTAGFMIECVSEGEARHAFASVPGLQPEEVLFTPNFAPRAEYEFGFARGLRVTLDNLYPLEHWPDLFAGREVFVRVDPGFGRGHHQHVRTAGLYSKFGVPVAELDALAQLAAARSVKVVGLHAHSGSGIFDVDSWVETGRLLAELTARFPDVRTVDLGGGLGVPDYLGAAGVDLEALDRGVASLRRRFPHLAFWMEPGRFMVARAGVLVAEVTQLKGKGEVRYVGVATGMNSLIRPALYGAHHEVVNLSRFDEPATQIATVVGPICESADRLATDRWLPVTQEGDVLLLANCGAYGFAMASNYNLRAPAREFMIGE
ncbi:MAG: bifunctional aspartate kinase/diaminopimelate decarboxylase [Gammaproteobacteria bacterium]|nr:bifunctional aspartate kinase/diaminopimelate decarboxylase [Gammaproteobacteria bacterium]